MDMEKLHQIYSQRKISDKEYHLIELLREMKYGQATVFVQGGQPDRVEKLRESIKL